MEVSQAAIDEVRAVRLADEAALRAKKLAGLTKIVDCCATCDHWEGWLDNVFCTKHEIYPDAFLICNDHERRTT